MVAHNYDYTNNMPNWYNGTFNYNPSFCGGSAINSIFCGTDSPLNNCYSMGGFMGMQGYNNPFMQCNGEMNWMKMLGFQLGQLAICFAGKVGGDVIAKHQEQKNANSVESASSQIDNIESKIDALCKKVDATEDEIMNFDIENTEEAKEYNSAKSAYDSNEKVINDYKKDDIEKIIKNYEATTTLPEGETKPTEDQYNSAKASQASYNEAISNRDKLKTAMEKAQEKKEALENKMKEAKEELEDLKAQLDDAWDTYDDRVFTRGIGKESKLVKDDKYNTDITSTSEVQFTKAHLQTAASKYRKAKTDEEKTKYKDQFNKIYSYLLEHDASAITGDMEQIYEIINP